MSNLLEKASIVTTPTAYDNGKILSVKPAPSLGSELVVNGDFATDSNWSKNGQVTIGGGVAYFNSDGTFTQIAQTLSGISSKNAKVVIEVTEYNQGTLKVLFSGGAQQNLPTSVGTHTLYFNNVSSNTLNIARVGGVTDIKIDNLSVKEVIDGDFDFTRNSSATRVNSQGLIEDVQILSSNLVSNGDFSQEGSEEVTNGDFSNGSTDWSVVGLATISNSVASFVDNGTNGSAYISQNVFTVGKFYKVTFDITRYVAGGIQLQVNSFYSVDISGGVGTYTTYVKSDNIRLLIKRDGSFPNYDFDIDNVSVKEVGQDWTVSNGTITDKYNASMTAYQTGIRILPFSNTGTFKVTFDLVVTSGSCKFDAGGSNNAIYSTSGTKELIATNITKFEFNAFNLGWVGTLDNVSVIEITEDTNLPRIDYTGGEGHWLFEPQSTNLVTYSEVYGSGTYFSSFQGSTFDNTTSLSPSGENNATQLTSTGAGKLQTSGISLSQNTDYTLSFYAKNVDATEVTSRVLGLGGSGGSNLTPISYFNELSTTEWKRITHSFNTGTNTTFYLYLLNALNSGGTIQIWGAQLEQSSFATSIIPTNGSTVTRLQDAAFGAGSSDLINSTEGVLYAEIAALSENYTGRRFITLNDATASNGAVLRYEASGVIVARYQISGIAQCSIAFAATITNYHKIAFKYSLNDFALWVDGVEVGVDSSGNVLSDSVLNNIDFNSGNGTFPFFGKAKCLAVFKEALTDAELTCLTTI